MACPEGYDPDPQVLEFAKSDPAFTLYPDATPAEAAVDADVIVTDVWASMGQEGEAAKRRNGFRGLSGERSADEAGPSRTAWCSTACPPTGERRSPRRCSRPTPTRFLRRRKIVSTPKKLSCIF